MDVENLMTQKKEIQLDSKGDYLKAIQLNHSQVQTIRDNYIHNKLNRHIPNWRHEDAYIYFYNHACYAGGVH